MTAITNGQISKHEKLTELQVDRVGYLCNVFCKGSEKAVQNSVLISDVSKSELHHLQNKLVVGYQKCQCFRTPQWLSLKRAAIS